MTVNRLTTPAPKRLKSAVRVLVTVTLLALAISFVDLDTLADDLRDVGWAWLGVAVALVGVIILFEARQFAQVALAFGHDVGALQFLRMSLVGRFFALLTPAMLGNDIYRAMAMHSLGTGGRRSVSLAAISRIVSLMALGPVMVAGLPFIARYTWGTAEFWLFAVVVGLTVLTCFLLLHPAGAHLLAGTRWRALREVAHEATQLRFVALQASVRFRLWVYAVLQHVIRVFAVMAVAKAYGVTADWTVFFGFVPVSLLIAMIPVSIGSWGVREIALVFSLGSAGVAAGPALLTSVSFGLLGMLFALCGGLIWMTGIGTPPPRIGSEKP
ncbi:lysylphosphatidylglycerol synthase transmembrane domain-containing protein [Tropicimonas sp. S265A]|uniref:lysylphosphatidylglycerol synthase transmembrane domain-containing protein n=1 Tax=Tropicimonas sp. S265A TaxID=3415134 RepID=UPI003C7BB93A